MKLLVALAVVASQPAPHACEASPDFIVVQALGDVAVDCVLAAARRLERSRERADMVAVAAISSCERELSIYRSRMARKCGLVLARSTDRILRERLKDKAIATVVEMRASRP